MKSDPLFMLLVGPSGSGKTTVADTIAAERGLYHLDGDRLRKADRKPFGVHRMRKQWDAFRVRFDAQPLAARLSEIAEEKDAHGVVVTLPPSRPTRLLSLQHVRVAQDAGIQTIILCGPEELLFEAVRDRPERKEGPHDTDWERRWRDRNGPIFDLYGGDEFAPIRVEVSHDGRRRPLHEIVQEALALVS